MSFYQFLRFVVIFLLMVLALFQRALLSVLMIVYRSTNPISGPSYPLTQSPASDSERIAGDDSHDPRIDRTRDRSPPTRPPD